MAIAMMLSVMVAIWMLLVLVLMLVLLVKMSNLKLVLKSVIATPNMTLIALLIFF